MNAKTITTFKSGKFVFSSTFKKAQVSPLIMEFQILYETIKDLPILPALATRLEEELIRRSIFSTAAIEGNPLREEEVNRIITEKDYI